MAGESPIGQPPRRRRPVTCTAAFAHNLDGGWPEGLFTRTLAIDGKTRPYTDFIRWTPLIGGVHLPATVPPLGRTRDGLPVGVQVVAGHYEDRTALAFARSLAELVGADFVAPPRFAS